METETLRQIKTMLSIHGKPVTLCSFGKDSMVLLHLVHRIDWSIPIIFWRDPFMQTKNEFSYKAMQDMNLEVYDYPPSGTDFCYANGEMNVIYRQSVGAGIGIFLLRGLASSDKGLCLFKDFLQRPTVPSYSYKWDLTFSGHKNCDVDKMLGSVKVDSPAKNIGGTTLFYPLKDWTDNNIWDYIHRHNVPYNTKRYDEQNNAYNNDFYECCYACVNPDMEDFVFCHQDNKKIKNYGKRINYEQKIHTIKTLTGV